MVDPVHKAEFEAAIARTNGTQLPSYKINPSHTFFYSSDYTLHTQPDYSFNVRTVSTRTKRTESGNGENLIGKFLPDGATNIQVRGDEYYNIMPVWEWDKIPGITARDYAEDQPTTIQWGEEGSTNFVGGVSDSSYGATAYDMNYHGITAKKSWFFFDKEVVCLGAGINCEATENVTTTINQCWLKGSVEVDGKKVDGGNIASYETPSWIRHDGIGYYFPEKEKVVVSSIKQTGDLYHINHSTPKKPVSDNVFKLWINHGANPANAHYAYIVVPNATNSSLDNLKSIKIIANNDSLQAVKNEVLDITEAVLYKPSTITVGDYSFKSATPCILMVRGKKKLYIADPTQLLTGGKISITNNKTNTNKVYSIHFPTGDRAGASLLVELE
jgi:chondroitin AC lyase